MQSKRVSIIGGGIAGLTTANFFAKLGHQTRIFERAKHFIPTVGSGIMLAPNGQRVLNQLGYFPGVSKFLHPVKTLEVRSSSGRLLGRTSVERVQKSSGYFMSGCKRSELIQFLADKLPPESLHYDKEFETFSKKGNSIEFTMKDGSSYETDILIGADGIRSTVANFVAPQALPLPNFTGYQVHWGTIHDTNAPAVQKDLKAISKWFPSNTTVAFFGKGAFLLTFMTGGVHNPCRAWAVLSKAPKKIHEEDWTVLGEKAHALDITKDFIPEIGRLINITDDILHFGLYDRDPVPHWSRGNVVLVGDACHTTLPTAAAQGANMALEDSYILAEMFSKYPDDTEKAFAEYQKQRVGRTGEIVSLGRIIAKFQLSTNPIFAQIRDMSFPLLLNTGLLVRALEYEIVNRCPVPAEARLPFQW